MEGFQNKFFRPLFTVIFRPKMVFLDTDSILRVETMYEQLIYCELSTKTWMSFFWMPMNKIKYLFV